jgi:hypothetical protein
MALQQRYSAGQRVRVTQQVPRLSGVMSTTVEGTVVRFGQSKTGSWYAHSKDHKLWLDRLELRKDDGEMVVVNLDQYSHVEILSERGASAGGDGSAAVPA